MRPNLLLTEELHVPGGRRRRLRKPLGRRRLEFERFLLGVGHQTLRERGLNQLPFPLS